MKKAVGRVFKYGDNVDTDVIIPARYLNSSDPAELATHCMEDIDKDFVKNVKKGDIIVELVHINLMEDAFCIINLTGYMTKDFIKLLSH